MAAENRSEGASVVDQLFDEASQFDFFQAVRLLARYQQQRFGDERTESRLPVGVDSPPDREFVRFRSTPSFGFPAGTIHSIKQTKQSSTDDADELRPVEMFVSFFGLTGPSGVLPDHYTQLLCERLRRGDPTLHEFLDLFHHRLVSLFYRAWQKYSDPFSFGQAERDAIQGSDRFSSAVYGLIGLGTECQRERLKLSDESLLYYAGHFADQARPTQGLEALLSDYLHLPITIEPFQGRWLYLNEEDLSRIPSALQPEGRCSVLGVDFVIGNRIWDVQSKFRIILGPLDYEQFLRFLPIGDDCQTLYELTRLYVGIELDFDVQPVLWASEIPQWKLESQNARAPRLGWNTWCYSVAPDSDAENVLFVLETLERNL